jgi:hypothetical protein
VTTIYVAEEHHRLYWLWREQDAHNLRLCHVDFHCDMRGLLIDRPAQQATLFDDRERAQVDQGNFLAHAITEGTVSGVRWFHDPFGGRRYDHGTVRYESDLRVRLSRRRDEWRPVHFEEQDLADWRGPLPGEHLDLDWDAFANTLYTPEHSARLQERFLQQPIDHKPDVVYFIYSYCSSVLDDDAFESFLERLRLKLDADVVRLSPLPPEHSTVSREKSRYQRLRARLIAPIKQPKLWLSSALKTIDTAHDLP